jgi:hypothetical protein
VGEKNERGEERHNKVNSFLLFSFHVIKRFSRRQQEVASGGGGKKNAKKFLLPRWRRAEGKASEKGKEEESVMKSQNIFIRLVPVNTEKT